MTALGTLLAHLLTLAVGFLAGVVATCHAAGIRIRRPRTSGRHVATDVGLRIRDAWTSDVESWQDAETQIIPTIDERT